MGLNRAIEALLAEKQRESRQVWPDDEIGQSLRLWGFEPLQTNSYRMSTPRMVYTIARMNNGGYKIIAKAVDKSFRFIVTGIKERRQLELLLKM